MPDFVPPSLFPGLLFWSALWSGVSVVALYRLPQSACPCWKGFWLMNGTWTAANVLILAYGLRFPAETLEEFVEVLRLNARLDLAYLACAAALAGLGRKNPLLLGLAAAILIQGLFLLGYDHFWIHRLSP